MSPNTRNKKSKVSVLKKTADSSKNTYKIPVIDRLKNSFTHLKFYTRLIYY